MRILAVGGGSGGHVTPVVAVLRELKKRDQSVEVRFWCDRKFAPQARSILRTFDAAVPVQTVLSGKLRRYNNLPLWRQLLRPVSIVLPNIWDMILVFCGAWQSVLRLLFWRPDVIFTKGGFVCLPVGMAARMLRIPLVIHDSDAHPGLTNRILAKWATAIGTGAPLHFYPYPATISRYVGIPVNEAFTPFNSEMRRRAKQDLGFDSKKPLVVVTGGGLGAQRINMAVAACLSELLPYTSLLLISGSGQYDDMRSLTPQDDPRYQLRSFVTDTHEMASLLGAADIVVTRAGATTLLELAAMAKPTIVIPNGYLTGGHQLKNADAYAQKKAVVVLDEHKVDEDPMVLARAVIDLLKDEKKMHALSTAMSDFAKPHSASDVADMIISAVKKA